MKTLCADVNQAIRVIRGVPEDHVFVLDQVRGAISLPVFSITCFSGKCKGNSSSSSSSSRERKNAGFSQTYTVVNLR